MFGSTVVGIDVGSTALRAVWLKGSRGQLQVVKAVRQERELDSEVDLSGLLGELKSKKVPLSSVALGVSGGLATLRYNLLPPVPDWRLEMIMKYETQELAEKSGESLSCDYRALDLPESVSEDQVLLVGLGKEDQIQPMILDLEQGGGRAHQAVPNALAVFHAYVQSHAKPPQETVLLADVGAHETHVVLVTDGRLIFARTVNFGGRNIDEAIAGGLGIREEQARKLKEGIQSGRIPDHLAENAGAAIRSALGQLNSILQSSITFCRAQTKIPEIRVERVLVSGGTTRLPQLQPFLEAAFKVPVEKMPVAVSGEALPGGVDEWTTAIGLAACRLDPERQVLDLLPAPARAKREFRERTLFLWGAAAVLVLSLAVTLVTGYLANSQVGEQTAEIDGWKQRVTGWERERVDAKAENNRIRVQTSRLDRENEVAWFVSKIMEIVEGDMPAAIALEKLRTERIEDDGQVYLNVELEGAADNSERDGIEHLRTFQKQLEDLPAVQRVVMSPPALESGAYQFKLIASPNAEPPPEKGRGPRRGPGKGKGRLRG